SSKSVFPGPAGGIRRKGWLIISDDWASEPATVVKAGANATPRLHKNLRRATPWKKKRLGNGRRVTGDAAVWSLTYANHWPFWCQSHGWFNQQTPHLIKKTHAV